MSDLLTWCDKVDDLAATDDGLSVMLGGDAVPLIVAIIRAAERRRLARVDRDVNHMRKGYSERAATYYRESRYLDSALTALADHLTREAGREA